MPTAARARRTRAVVSSAALLVVAVVLPTAPNAAQQVPTVLAETQACADLGAKRPGDRSTQAMADHIAERFAAAGLAVERESFNLPVHESGAVTAEVLAPSPATYEALSLAYGAAGTVEADVVAVGSGRPSDYAGRDVTGKIVLVRRDTTFHRSAQLNEVVARGGAAMLYVSDAPDNLIQIGTVRFAQHPPPAILTVTVGAADGARLQELARAGTLRMRLSVDAQIVNAVGTNVLGTKRGTTRPDKVVMVGGHYDSWYAGAVDNCSAIGSMLHLVEAIAAEPLPYTVVFGAWDAEEVGLTGSYDWVRRHPDVVERIVVLENLEMVAAATQLGGRDTGTSVVNLAFGTLGPAMNAVLAESMARTGHVALPTTAPVIRESQGGIIPTDLQPFYAQGVQGFSTFSSSAYYHTTQDDTVHIPPGSHQRVTEFLLAFLRDVQRVPPEVLQLREVPSVEVTAPASVQVGQPIEVTIRATDPAGQPLTGNPPRLLVNRDDHWPVLLEQATEVGGGTYTYTVDAASVDRDGTLWFTTTFGHTLYAAEGFARTEVEDGPMARRAGGDRVATAAAVARSAFEQADTAVVASAGAFPDALAGAPLATAERAPLLLTDGHRLSPATRMELTRLRTAKVVLLGGRAAISDAVADELVERGYAVERVSGADRYATSAAIAQRMGVRDRVALASGEQFPDALGMAALAAIDGIPLLLTAAHRLPDPVARQLRPGVDVTIAGGSGAVGDAVLHAVDRRAGAVERLAGPDRYTTSARIAERALAGGAPIDGAWLATGRRFPDGLVAAAAAGAAEVPLVLVDGTDPAGAPATFDLLARHARDVGTLNVAGGHAAVGNDVLAALRSRLAR